MKSPLKFIDRYSTNLQVPPCYMAGLFAVLVLVGCQDRSPEKATGSAADAASPNVGMAQQSLTESQKIEHLINAVASLDGATFIRNGTTYSAADAASHLRQKLGSAGSWAETALDFIENIASKSSITGEEYAIHFNDGRRVKAGEYLRQELAKLH